MQSYDAVVRRIYLGQVTTSVGDEIRLLNRAFCARKLKEHHKFAPDAVDGLHAQISKLDPSQAQVGLGCLFEYPDEQRGRDVRRRVASGDKRSRSGTQGSQT